MRIRLVLTVAIESARRVSESRADLDPLANVHIL